MDASLWDDVIAGLSPAYRCLAPTLPLGAHRIRHAPGRRPLAARHRPPGHRVPRPPRTCTTSRSSATTPAARSSSCSWPARRARRQPGRAGLVRRLRQLPARPDREDAVPGRPASRPRCSACSCSSCGCAPVRRLPVAFGWLTKRGDAATARWLRPVLTQPEIRRDTVTVLRAAAADTGLLHQGGRRPDRLPAPGPDRLGQPGPRDAARARPPPGRAAPRQRAGRGGRQLHAHPPGPARPPGSGHPRLHRQPEPSASPSPAGPAVSR